MRTIAVEHQETGGALPAGSVAGAEREVDALVASVLATHQVSRAA